MDKRLDGRIAVVTGGAQGIGHAIAARFAREGASVVIADINAVKAEEAAAALAAAGGRVTALPVDIADDASVRRLARAVEDAHGGCDILVNNAAVGDMTTLAEMSMERYGAVLDINQHGAVRMVLAFVPMLKRAAGRGRILNIASIMGVRGWPDSIPYSTAKGAIVNFTRALAADLAPDRVTVNALAPGFVNTPMSIMPDGSHEYDADWFRDIYIKYRRLPLGRYGEPDDMAGPAFFLCSDDAAYVTGQVLLVDGGTSATF